MDHYRRKVIAGKKLVLKCFILLLGTNVWWQDIMLRPWTALRPGGREDIKK